MRTGRMLIAVALMGLPASTALADHHQHCEGCRKMKKVCEYKLEKKKGKKTYFEIECKEVCIPRARIIWPWQKKSYCEEKPRCGRVRVVRKLVKKSHPIETCVYKGEVVHLCNECADDCCSDYHVTEQPCPSCAGPQNYVSASPACSCSAVRSADADAQRSRASPCSRRPAFTRDNLALGCSAGSRATDSDEGDALFRATKESVARLLSPSGC